jgi:hypothetical protein
LAKLKQDIFRSRAGSNIVARFSSISYKDWLKGRRFRRELSTW